MSTASLKCPEGSGPIWEVNRRPAAFEPYESGQHDYAAFVDATTGVLLAEEARITRGFDVLWQRIRRPEDGEDWIDPSTLPQP